MNKLNRSLKPGEEVIVLKEHFREVDAPEKERIFICESGFGMQAATTGSKIFGHWKKENSPGMIRGDNIDPQATLRHQSKTRFTAGCMK